MTNSQERETAPSALLGRICLIVFLLFNAAMFVWLLVLWQMFGEDLNTSSEVERAGAAIDATATTSIVLGLWAIGAAITGLAAYLTRHPRN